MTVPQGLAGVVARESDLHGVKRTTQNGIKIAMQSCRYWSFCILKSKAGSKGLVPRHDRQTECQEMPNESRKTSLLPVATSLLVGAWAYPTWTLVSP